MLNFHKIKHKKTALFFFILLLVIIIVVVYLVLTLSKPVSSNVQSDQQQTYGITDYNIDLTPVLISGQYASFDYPKGVPLVSKDLTSQPSVEDFVFYAKDISSWTLAVDVSRTPLGTLDESSSYTLRRDNPQTYTQTNTTINGQSVVIMTDNSFVGGFSKVAYMTHGIYVASVSLTGNDSNGTGPLQTSFNMVLNSWHWQ